MLYPGMNIILIGPPGSGKTSIASILSSALHMPTLDIDNDHLEKIWKCSVSEKLSALGDESFLDAECDATLELNVTGTIISTTGSNPVRPKAIEYLKKNGLIVYLDAFKDSILDRLDRMKVTRVVGQSSKSMAEILDYRAQFYEACYDVRVVFGSGENDVNVNASRVLDCIMITKGFIGTRSDDREVVSFPEAIINGMAKNSGLYVPRHIPSFTCSQLERFVNLSFQERALRILEGFDLSIPSNALREMLQVAYTSFNHNDVLPVSSIGGVQYIMEMYHGPTASFKDLSLQLAPHLYSYSASKYNKNLALLVATSGDTGCAVLDGFQSVGIPVVLTFPHFGVSAVQRRQMMTHPGDIRVAPVLNANFDQCQTLVKECLTDAKFTSSLNEEFGISLTAANSINVGRFLPQVTFAVSSYLDLVRKGVIKIGDEVDITIPTGNFGNILGVYVAKLMGIPINQLICASNENNVLTDFITTGRYDLRTRELQKTISPSIDILVSSNLERILFMLSNGNGNLVKSFFDQLKKEHYFDIPSEMHTKLKSIMKVGSCTQDQCIATIKQVFIDQNVILDPHTAVGKFVADSFTGNRPMLIASTAHWGKFPSSVLSALSTEFESAQNNTESVEDLNIIYSELSRIIGDAYPPMHPKISELLNLKDRNHEPIECNIHTLQACSNAYFEKTKK